MMTSPELSSTRGLASRTNASCPAPQAYRGELPIRFAKEAANLVQLTGWARNEVEAEMENAGQSLKR